ncbi:MAG: cysteine hydrolase, partial [Dehalococcoidia bacterium]|nr:cysteine hydrolase [Dehalococcoidia bacterium]
MKRIQTVEANPANAVLILVNLQNEFCKPGGLVFDEINPQAMPGVIAAAQRFLGKARAASIPVIYVQSLRRPHDPQFTRYGLKPILKEGAWNSNIVDELTSAAGEAVVTAWHEDPTYETRLDH